MPSLPTGKLIDVHFVARFGTICADKMPTPRVKTKSTSVESPRSRCGDNWDKNIKVRNPYRGVDRYFRNMLSLAEQHLVASHDDEIPGQLELERKRVKKLQGDKATLLSLPQRRNVDRYLENAKMYIEDAAKIQRMWSNGFITDHYGSVDPLPINVTPAPGVCFEARKGHEKDSLKWTSLILSSLKNIRCAEEVIRKAEVLKMNKADFEKSVSTRARIR